MTLVLNKTRACDGSCCKDHPRFPNEDGTDCIYHKPPVKGKESSGCMLMTNSNLVPPDNELFQRTCVEWPQNMYGRGTGNCCWQWIDDGN